MWYKIIKIYLTLTSLNFAASYYVSVNSGNDANTGSNDSPFKTINYGLSVLHPGDTLLVILGDYNQEGDLYIDKSGNEDKPIVIKSQIDKGAKVRSFKLSGQSWVEIIGFKICGDKELPNGWKDMPEVIVDNPSIQIDPLLVWDQRHPLILDKYKSYILFNDYGTSDTSWQSLYTQGIYVESCKNILIADNDISLHTVGIEIAKESKSISVTGNEIYHCLDGIYGAVPGILYNFSYANSIISGNYVHQIFREGIRLTGSANNNLVEYNTVYYSGHSHIVTYGAGGYNTIRNNVVRFGGYYTETMRHPGSSGISIHSGGPGNLVDGNTITHQYDITLLDGNGVITDYNPDGAVVVNNIIYKVMGAGINSIYSGNNLFIHNTIVNAGENTLTLKNGMAVKLFSESDNNNVIANNIFFNCKNGGIFANAKNLSDQKYINHNLYFFATGVPLAADGTDPANFIYDLAELKEKGYGTNSIFDNPLLIDTASLDFNLHFTSPAIGKGTNTYSFQYDRNRLTRKNPPALGALEFGQSTGLEEEGATKFQFILYQNYPNPFNPSTNIYFSIPQAKEAQIIIHDILGREVKILFNDFIQPGNYNMNFNASNLASGVYFYTLIVGDIIRTRKMLLLK